MRCVSSRKLVARRVAAHLIATGKSPEEFGNEVGLSGMSVRRLLDEELAGHHPNNRTKRLIASGLGEDPSLLWRGTTAVTRRKEAA